MTCSSKDHSNQSKEHGCIELMTCSKHSIEMTKRASTLIYIFTLKTICNTFKDIELEFVYKVIYSNIEEIKLNSWKL